MQSCYFSVFGVSRLVYSSPLSPQDICSYWREGSGIFETSTDLVHRIHKHKELIFKEFILSLFYCLGVYYDGDVLEGRFISSQLLRIK